MSSASSDGRLDLFFGGRAREVFRNSRNEVFPDERAPMIKMLCKVNSYSMQSNAKLT